MTKEKERQKNFIIQGEEEIEEVELLPQGREDFYCEESKEGIDTSITFCPFPEEENPKADKKAN